MTTINTSTFNFASTILKTTVKCDCVGDDHYQVGNLISSDTNSRNRGFMAYHVTKPPIQLEFVFHFPIEIHQIIIKPKLGALLSTGFEIFTENGNRVAEISNINENKEGIIFKLNNANEDFKYSNYEIVNFFREYSLKKNNVLKIRITKTKNCVPVIKQIDILGRPSKLCTLEQIDEIKKLWNMNSKTKLYDYDKSEIVDKSNNESPSINEVDIPEEFLDSITYEIMALPMVLPSGKIVDQSTIDRHSNIEESHGRMPSDPFTAKTYSSTCRPLLDAALKSEIDLFLLRNQHRLEFNKIPRTTGKRSNNDQLSNSNKKPKLDIRMPLSYESIYQPSSSFDDVVKNALKGLTRYSSSRVQQNEPISKCINCESQEQLYKITKCEHITCLECFKCKENSDYKRCKCGVEINNSDLIKFHIK